MSVALRLGSAWPRNATRWTSLRCLHQTPALLSGGGRTLGALPWTLQERRKVAPGWKYEPQPEHEPVVQDQDGEDSSTGTEDQAMAVKKTSVPNLMTIALPSWATKDDFLSYIKRLNFNKNRAIGGRMPSAMTILTTRHFTKWLDDTPLMQELVRCLTHNAGPHMSVLTGVVDNIAPAVRYGLPREGFAFMMGHEAKDTPKNVTFMSPALDKTAMEVPPGRLRFVFKEFDSYQYPVAVDVPLANTLFQNGRHHTLNQSYWVGDPSRLNFASQKPLSQSIVVCQAQRPLHVDKFQVDLGPEIKAPLVALTKPRRIKSCLGNIISEIELDDGKAAPASTELETAVDVLLSNRTRRDGSDLESTLDGGSPAKESRTETVKEPDAAQPPTQMWALVAPSSPSRPSGSFDILEKALFGLESYSGDPDMERKVAHYNEHLLRALFERGCQLHRVESGGGGWGSRRGRLALDTNPSGFGQESSEADSTMWLNNGDEGAPPVLQKGLVAPGSWVMFLTAPQSPKDLPERPLTNGNPDPSEPAPPWGFAEDAVSPLQAADRSIRPGKPPRTFRLSTQGLTPFPHNILFGMSTKTSATDPHLVARTRFGGDIQLLRNHFSALSTQGVLVKSIAPSQKSNESTPLTPLQRFLDQFNARTKKNIEWSLDHKLLLALDLRRQKMPISDTEGLLGWHMWRRLIVALKRGALLKEGVKQLLEMGRDHDELRARWQRVGPGEMALGTKVDSPHSYVNVRSDGVSWASQLDDMRLEGYEELARQKEEEALQQRVYTRNKRLMVHKH